MRQRFVVQPETDPGATRPVYHVCDADREWVVMGTFATGPAARAEAARLERVARADPAFNLPAVADVPDAPGPDYVAYLAQVAVAAAGELGGVDADALAAAVETVAATVLRDLLEMARPGRPVSEGTVWIFAAERGLPVPEPEVD